MVLKEKLSVRLNDADYQLSTHIELFLKQKKLILRINVSYLTPNSSIAFPTPIFIRQPLSEIEYRIASKYSPEVVEGTITIDYNDGLL